MMEGEMGERDRGGCRISKNCMIDNIDMNTRNIGECIREASVIGSIKSRKIYPVCLSHLRTADYIKTRVYKTRFGPTNFGRLQCRGSIEITKQYTCNISLPLALLLFVKATASSIPVEAN